MIYVLGPAYSGSTLLGLLMGDHPAITNLGEVMNLEHDYSPEVACTCGRMLSECRYWSEVKEQILSHDRTNYDLSALSGRDRLDKRGGMHKLKLVLGKPLERVFNSQELEQYISKNVNFFSAVSSSTPSTEYIVDLSKSPERLEALLKSNEIKVYCINLQRNKEEVFASTIKRPKRTRAKYRFKSLREAIWLNLRMNHEKRVLRLIPQDRKITVHWESLSANPTDEMTRIFEFLKLKKHKEVLDQVDVRDQHIYVGNRWLFNLEDPIVKIKAKVENYKLAIGTKWLFKLTSFVFGNTNRV